MLSNPSFLQKAKELEPTLFHAEHKAKSIVKIARDDDGKAQIISEEGIEKLSSPPMSKGESVVYDFGNHYVGYVSFGVSWVGSPPDAPLFLKLKFGENAAEMTENSADYNGGLSSSWIEEEYLHIDVLPAKITLPRRYAARFFEIYVIDGSKRYKAVFTDVAIDAVTSADESRISFIASKDALMRKIDKVSIKTLCDCMQEVFEDGPKRDRRLWLGDLRLEALVNYETVKNYDLVKRCLYLFAGARLDDGAVGACLFTKPEVIVDDIYLYDYALFFVCTLLDYFSASGDRETAEELWEVALRQLEVGMEKLDENGLLIDRGNDFWCFIDWKKGLNKQAGGQAVLIYALKAGRNLARLLGKNTDFIEKSIERATNAAVKYLWDEKKGVFVSGSERQISYASQVWMILAGVFDREKSRMLLEKVKRLDPEMGMVTPYMYHNYVMSHIECGQKEEALSLIKGYWGEIVRDGADTFPELYNPKNKRESPYGSCIINSYCHAWSCTPAYIFRRQLGESAR